MERNFSVNEVKKAEWIVCLMRLYPFRREDFPLPKIHKCIIHFNLDMRITTVEPFDDALSLHQDQCRHIDFKCTSLNLSRTVRVLVI